MATSSSNAIPTWGEVQTYVRTHVSGNPEYYSLAGQIANKSYSVDITTPLSVLELDIHDHHKLDINIDGANSSVTQVYILGFNTDCTELTISTSENTIYLIQDSNRDIPVNSLLTVILEDDTEYCAYLQDLGTQYR